MSAALVTKTIKDSVATITLNRPDVLNSFNRQMSGELLSAITACADETDVRAVLLTGAGRGFCAGQDLADIPPSQNGASASLGKIVRECYNPIILALRRIEKPVICAVNGVAAGAGANLALACDIVFASTQASFIQSFCKVGLIPDSGGTFFLPRLLGLPRATALMMLGEKIAAEQAVQIGLIYKAVAAEKLLEEASALAVLLATQPTKGLGLIKRGINASLGNSLAEQLKFEEVLQDEAGRTADYAEGVRAFLEKRAPQFRGA